MLTFTTTEAFSLFGGEPTRPLVPQRERRVLNGEKFSCCVYLHGDVEHKAGFDIPVLVEGEIVLSGRVMSCLSPSRHVMFSVLSLLSELESWVRGGFRAARRATPARGTRVTGR
jgi:hypothetical protein